MNQLLSRLNLRHIRLIDAIARTGQISLAAERLAITQPAASRTLAEIENLVGSSLFDRRPKGMVTTPLGTVMAHRASTIMSELEVTVSEIDAFQTGLAGSVRIGAVTGPAISIVVPAAQRLKQEATFCEVSVDVAPSVQLVEGLLAGEYDIVLSRVPPGVDRRLLDVRRGRVEEVCFVTRTGHSLQAGPYTSFDQLVGMTWVIQRTGMPIRDAVEQAFMNRNLPVPRDTIVTASLVFTMGYLRNSDAIAAMSSEVFGLLAESDKFRAVAMKESIILSPYHVITRRNQRMTPVCRRMLKIVTSEIAI